MYEVLLERQAEKDLRALEREAFDGITVEIRALGDDPRPPGCRCFRPGRVVLGKVEILLDSGETRR